MKKIFKSKITMVILACLLLVGVFAGVSALANDTPDLKIEGVNLKHDGQAKLVYEITSSDLSDGVEDNMTMYFWGTYPTEEMLDDPQLTSKIDYSTEKPGTLEAISRGFAPVEMTQVVYAQAVYKNGDKESRSNIVRYSIIEYLVANKVEGNQTWNAMIDYVTYAQKYLGWTETSAPSDLTYVELTGGYIGNTQYTHGMYLKGEELTIVPDCEESAFTGWYANGELVSSDYEYTFTLEAAQYVLTVEAPVEEPAE